MSILFSSFGSPVLSSKTSRILIQPLQVNAGLETQSLEVKISPIHETDAASCLVMKKCPEISN